MPRGFILSIFVFSAGVAGVVNGAIIGTRVVLISRHGAFADAKIEAIESKGAQKQVTFSFLANGVPQEWRESLSSAEYEALPRGKPIRLEYCVDRPSVATPDLPHDRLTAIGCLGGGVIFAGLGLWSLSRTLRGLKRS
jgi:hypothetical protein